MMKRLALLFALLFVFALPSAAEEDSTLALAQQALAGRVEELKFDGDAPDPFVRAAYEITLPETLPEAIEPYYGGYERVILLEYGCYQLYPIVTGEFLAVGVKADGSMEECLTPSGLTAKTFDLEPLKEWSVAVLPVEG
ncbi:MAG TPA: hypothetical protein IAA59_03420 [Candidatus Faecaligallichristensenella faecipullorum]|nr:hypothetical protein [Candidatus Faecaligallichristensenella faecipullorum]